VTRLNLRRLGRHPIDFAALRLDANWTGHSLWHGRSEILQKVHAGSRILNQYCGRAILRSETDDFAAEIRIFEATSVDMHEVRITLVDKPPHQASPFGLRVAQPREKQKAKCVRRSWSQRVRATRGPMTGSAKAKTDKC